MAAPSRATSGNKELDVLSMKGRDRGSSISSLIPERRDGVEDGICACASDRTLYGDTMATDDRELERDELESWCEDDSVKTFTSCRNRRILSSE